MFIKMMLLYDFLKRHEKLNLFTTGRDPMIDQLENH